MLMYTLLASDRMSGRASRIARSAGREIDLHIDNRITLTQDACGDWRERIKPAVVGETIAITGDFSAQCGEKALNLSPWPADRQVEDKVQDPPAGHLGDGRKQHIGAATLVEVGMGAATHGAVDAFGQFRAVKANQRPAQALAAGSAG